ncbi:MAG: SurA N-terminal domain-containing protein [Kiritimatiellae bacterium]|nr:SurA N-terminal domain-containing protein [Kiritimatiellia bacterium]
MVILQFNKLIRNKWIWGVFAVAISAFFAFDFLLDGLNSSSDERSSDSAGTLAGEKIDSKEFFELADEIRGLGRNRDWKTEQSEVNRQAWENCAALRVARDNGIEATDAEVMAAIRRDPSFQANGAFSFSRYSLVLRENSLTPEKFEASLKRRMTLMRIARSVLGSAVWCSPMELDQGVADETDVFTVKVARFSQSKKDADAVKLDDNGVKKWYDENVESLALPERLKIRYVAFDATDAALQARMIVTEDEMRDRYDTTIDKYTSTDTNGVETVKKFEEVKDEIEKDLRKIAAVQYYETNLNFRVYASRAREGGSRLDEIAAEDGLKVQTSAWFSVEGPYQEGFMSRPYQILPGARTLNEAVAELDPANEDLRYAIVSSERTVWLIERAETSAAHTPTFEEAKDAIRPRALKAARADAFKASVEAIAAKGVASILATKDVSTNIVFCVADLRPGEFPDQAAITSASAGLYKGDVSEFTLTGPGRAILVVCEDRKEGDAAKAMIKKSSVQNEISMLAAGQLPEAWRKYNLDKLGFEPSDVASVEKTLSED